MARDINSMEYILDSRDVIARRDELQDERDGLRAAVDDAEAAHDALETDCSDEQRQAVEAELAAAWGALDDFGHDELKQLDAFIDEGSSEWAHGETLIRESHFETYAQELAEDIGAIPEGAKWPCTCIDWEQAARELRYDYTGADFGDVTYYYRS